MRMLTVSEEVTTFFLSKISVLDPLRALEPPFQES